MNNTKFCSALPVINEIADLAGSVDNRKPNSFLSSLQSRSAIATSTAQGKIGSASTCNFLQNRQLSRVIRQKYACKR